MRTFLLVTSGACVALVSCFHQTPLPCPDASPPSPRPSLEAALPKPIVPHDPPAVAIVRSLSGSDPRGAYDAFSQSFRDAVPFDKMASIIAASERRLGPIIELRLGQEAGPGQPSSTVVAFHERGAEVFTVTLDKDGVLTGLRVRDLVERADSEGPGPAADYVAKRAYVLPGKGPWYVANGGNDATLNHHVGNKQQWYAFDIDKRDDKGNEARGEGKKNEDHYVFGEPVLAPAPGTIVFVIDAVEDYPPGERERYIITGNTVIIDHGDDEFSVLAHFKKGSIVVKTGQRVKVGQTLGLVGNSGNSSDPHTHWHLATSGGLSRGHGLPIRFAPLLVNGKRVENARPARGDVIENAP